VSAARRRLTLIAAVVAVAAVAVVVVLVARGGDDDGPRRSAAATTKRPAPQPALRSRPDLRPPKVDVLTPARGTKPGLMLVAPKKVYGAQEIPNEQQGPMLVDDEGRVRWFHPVPDGEEAYDLRVQRLDGKPVITWWQGRAVRGSGQGVGMIYDTSYQPVARVEPAGGAIADIHEFLLTDRGTALLIIYESGVRRDLSGIGGKRDAKVVDGIIQEVDVKTGKVLFEWSALDHIDVSESHEPLDKLYIDSWDYVHFNSVEEDVDGNLIVSARHTWAVYKIDRDTGEVIWRLGGKRSDFPLSDDDRFSYQHDARVEGRNRVRIFDNAAASEKVRPQSRVVTYELDPEAKTAKLVRTIEHPDKVSSGTQANAQLLEDGHMFVGWGSQGRFSEFGPDGDLLFDARVQRGFDSYRAYRAPWRSSRHGQPAVAVERKDGRTTAYASWNGSTEVQSWQVLTGSSPERLRPVGDRVDWDGLETALQVEDPQAYVAVRAYDGDGRAIGDSPAERLDEDGGSR